MAYKVEESKDAEYVRVIFEGPTSKREHEDGRAEAARALAARGWNRLLVDARGIQTEMSLSDDFEFTDQHNSARLQHVQVAAVHRPEEAPRFRFIENVAKNRGQNMRTFTDPDKAIDWLLNP